VWSSKLVLAWVQLHNPGMISEEQLAKVAALYAEHGYLVVARVGTCAMGEIVDNVAWQDSRSHVPQPFRVVGEATKAEFLEQSRAAGGGNAIGWPYDNFYRVITD
jgi:hypothetical protein